VQEDRRRAHPLSQPLPYQKNQEEMVILRDSLGGCSALSRLLWCCCLLGGRFLRCGFLGCGLLRFDGRAGFCFGDASRFGFAKHLLLLDDSIGLSLNQRHKVSVQIASTYLYWCLALASSVRLRLGSSRLLWGGGLLGCSSLGGSLWSASRLFCGRTLGGSTLGGLLLLEHQ